MEIIGSLGEDQATSGDRSVWFYCARRNDPKGIASPRPAGRICRTHIGWRLVPLVEKKAICAWREHPAPIKIWSINCFSCKEL
jgi:hypothetical protein